MNLPKHVVIIPDGNRRWAIQKKRPVTFGYLQGAQAVEDIIKAAHQYEIPYLTLWGSSVSNITDRSQNEVSFLFELYRQNFEKLLKNKDIVKNQVRVRVLGRWEELFPEKTKKPIRKIMESTKNHDKLHLTFLLAYSGTDEMKTAIEKIAAKNAGQKITEEVVKNNLWTHDLPPVDLVIRTGGEPHWSAGFLMWDVAEAQLYFTKKYWPEFTPMEFKKALKYYSDTQRRFGK